jgi:GH15 family glucan-1,4-alpha-glucosidase
VIRRLRCTRGEGHCRLLLQPQDGFTGRRKIVTSGACHAALAGQVRLGFWSSAPIAGSGKTANDKVEIDFRLQAGEEIWCVLGPGEETKDWTETAAAELLQATTDYWEQWAKAIAVRAGSRHAGVLRSAMLIHLLTFAPTGALVASPTTSLPERIGGNRNYDYRYTWIRDASLGLDLLARLGMTEDAKCFIDWLVGLESESGRPLQIVYAIDGTHGPKVVEHKNVEGYRRSQPVRTGNAAASMLEIDSFGYFTECMLTYFRHGGDWEEKHWTLIRRLADYTVKHWRDPGSSIWELRPKRQYLASKTMSAVTLDRAARIAERTGRNDGHIACWRRTYDEILSEIMSLGWSPRLGAFRQHYDADTLDSSALLIPLMGLLPVHHPRVTSTMEKLIEGLDVNGFLHRFAETEAVHGVAKTVGDAEGAFLICTFWLAQLLAQRGEVERADAILRRAEEVAGELCLFSEAIDARDGTFLGNMPLVFSQIEYARAAIALSEARGRLQSAVSIPRGESAQAKTQ